MSDQQPEIRIKGQPGFQQKVLSCPADVLIMGGSAGCGKTFCLLMEPLRYIKNPLFTGLILRREYVQITLPGGLWDKSEELFNVLPESQRPQMKIGNLSHDFPAGGKLRFDHIQTEASVYRYQGPEFAYIGFDELTHFTQKQFFYMLTRNRSKSGIKPLVRASTNPQGSGWVKKFIAWWIYPDNYPDESKRGFPIPERSGVLRYFVQIGSEIETIVWGDSTAEVWQQLPESKRLRLSNVPPEDYEKLSDAERFEAGKVAIRSITFIYGLLRDNPALLKVNPEYTGALLAQDETTQAQLLDGRWSDITSDARRLYSLPAINDLFTNSFVQRRADRYITADIALEGADRLIILVWAGWVVIHVESYKKTDGLDVWRILAATAQRWKVPGRNIAFDADGAGGFLKGFFKNSFAFTGNARPMLQDGEPKDGRPRPNYYNLRSQVYFLMRERLEDCEIFFDYKDLALQNDLIAELKAIKKTEHKDGDKLRIVPKDEIKVELGRSPDIADALVMRIVFELKPNTKPRARKVRVI